MEVDGNTGQGEVQSLGLWCERCWCYWRNLFSCFSLLVILSSWALLNEPEIHLKKTAHSLPKRQPKFQVWNLSRLQSNLLPSLYQLIRLSSSGALLTHHHWHHASCSMDPVMRAAEASVLSETPLKKQQFSFFYIPVLNSFLLVTLCSAVPGHLAYDRRRLSRAELHPVLGSSRSSHRSILLLLSVPSSPPHSPVWGQSSAFLSTGMHIFWGHSL